VTSLGHGSTYYVQQYILQWSLPWPLPLLLGGCAAGILGLLMAFLAMRRLRSDYLAISTIALSLVLWTVIGNQSALFNGWQGLDGIPRPVPAFIENAPGVGADVFFFVLTAAIAVLVFFISWRLYRSPQGRAWRAVREDEVAAESCGHPSFTAKLGAFLLGCVIAGIGGGLLAEYAGAYSTNAWLPLETFVVWAALIVGGPGNY